MSGGLARTANFDIAAEVDNEIERIRAEEKTPITNRFLVPLVNASLDGWPLDVSCRKGT